MNARHYVREAIAFVLALSILSLGGCSGDGLTGIDAEVSDKTSTPRSTVAKQGQSAYEVGGLWNWSREEHLTFPSWVAQAIFGVNPEGPTTTARCVGSGRMTLVQVGSTFTGLLDKSVHECVTKGGQVFQDPVGFAPTPIVGGKLQGRSLSMLLDGAMVNCRYHAIAKDVDGNTAVKLEGGGTCIVPGHPKSDVDLPPPPAGTSKTLSFTAVRL